MTSLSLRAFYYTAIRIYHYQYYLIFITLLLSWETIKLNWLIAVRRSVFCFDSRELGFARISEWFIRGNLGVLSTCVKNWEWGISLLMIFELARSGNLIMDNDCPQQKVIAPGYRATDLSQPDFRPLKQTLLTIKLTQFIIGDHLEVV